MNNKYDVKNFSDLIDQFKVEDEMKVIQDAIKQQTLSRQIETNQTIFDPLIDTEDRQKANYEFAKYQGTRYNIHELNESHQLLLEPPASLVSHSSKEEVINSVLDKTFIEQPLSDQYI